MPWSAFDESFGKFFKPIGRPAKPTRLMVGLHYLKHVYNLSGEEVVEHWVETPYHQYFCGFEFFQHELPIDPSSMTRWRKRVGPDTLEEVLKATVAVALETGTVKPSSLERVTVDTIVQPKAIAHPTDSRLYLKALLTLVGQAKKAGIKLRQSHTRLAKRAAMKAGRYAHAKQFKRMRRELKRRSTIEPMIGRAKNDGRLGRSYLLGTDGDKINALLAAAGHNLRLVLTRLAFLLARFIGAVVRLMTKSGQMLIAAEPEPVLSNIRIRLPDQTTSMA